MLAAVEVKLTDQAPGRTTADTVVIGLFEDQPQPIDQAAWTAAIGPLVDSGEAGSQFKKLALIHSDGLRYLIVGLGNREQFESEKARIAAAVVFKRAVEIGCKRLCWLDPDSGNEAIIRALIEGTLLATYRFDRFKSEINEANRIEELSISSQFADKLTKICEIAVTTSTAQNWARDLQNTPANELTPARLAAHAQQLANKFDGLTVEVDDRAGIIAREMRAFAAVAQGSTVEPALITLRYKGSKDSDSPTVAFVGKAVTFDTGGLSLKPPPNMVPMKFDMSAGAAVLAAIEAIAKLEIPVNILGVIGATENMPSGNAVKPSDIITTKSGLTVEINNTDAEGRLVLADCISYAIEQGAEKIVDLATLTGAIIVTFGSTYAGIMSNNDEWAQTILNAGIATDELLWRLPLNPEYGELLKSYYADLSNIPEPRIALSVTAAEFIRRFAGEIPWAHLDIAGVSWDSKRPYAEKGGTGFGVRLLVELAEMLAADQSS